MTDSIRISFCHHLSLSRMGGGEKWTAEVAKELAHRGHDVEVYATPVKVSAGVPSNPEELLGDVPYSEKYRHKVSSDVCYVTYHPLSWLNFKTIGKRIVGIHATTCWEPIDFNYGFLPVQAQILHRIFGKSDLNRNDAVHTVAGYLAINHPKVFRIPNFVDSTKFIPYKKLDKFTVTYASRKTYQKGWDIFQDISKKLVEEGINVRVSGDIPDEKMPEFIGESHVVVVPSRYDSFGLTTVEALMGKCFVVTSPLQSHKYLDLPFKYASSVEEYVDEIKSVKDMWENNPSQFKESTELLRSSTLKYDKPVIMDRLENMFKEVTLGW